MRVVLEEDGWPLEPAISTRRAVAGIKRQGGVEKCLRRRGERIRGWRGGFRLRSCEGMLVAVRALNANDITEQQEEQIDGGERP